MISKIIHKTKLIEVQTMKSFQSFTRIVEFITVKFEVKKDFLYIAKKIIQFIPTIKVAFKIPYTRNTVTLKSIFNSILTFIF